jgi:hypothetical protein
MSNRVTIKVTQRDIKEGIGHDCVNCPIASAINRSLEALGFDEDVYAYVEPYGMFWDKPVGIQIRSDFNKPLATLPISKMPAGVYEWAANFDDWDDMRAMGWRKYEKETGQERPFRPQPFSFVLNLDDFDKPSLEQ